MLRTKALVGVVSFAIALAVPWWTVSPGTSSAPVASAQAASAPQDSSAASSDSGSSGGADAGPAQPGPKNWRAMDKAMAKRDHSFPAKTHGTGATLLKPKVLPDGTKQFTLTAKWTKWEVEPGKWVDAMAYNGIVPGPTIHVNVGDKVQVIFKNELNESSSIHWHGVPIANNMDGVSDITQDPVQPGKTFVYKINATRPAVGWYHSHHDGVNQVPDGLYGMFLIGEMPVPKGVHVSQEVPYELQDSGTIGLSINGKSFPATAPVRAHKGDWVLVHYLGAGTMIHPIHLHGLDATVIAKDGYPLASPYKADTVLVAPGERYSLLVHADEVGRWAWHCHIFPHSEGAQGMFGMFTEFLVS